MTSTLTAAERDKAVLALRDIKGLLELTQKNPEYSDLTDIQNALESHGLRITAIPKPEPLNLSVSPASVAPAAPALTPRQAHTVEQFVQAYRTFKAQAKTGYVFKNDSMGSLLAVICPVAGIPFSK